MVSEPNEATRLLRVRTAFESFKNKRAELKDVEDARFFAFHYPPPPPPRASCLSIHTICCAVYTEYKHDCEYWLSNRSFL